MTNADLVQRLAAWEAYEADGARDAVPTERVCRWRSVLGLTLAQARTLMALCDRAGRLVSHDVLVEMARDQGTAEDVADILKPRPPRLRR